MFGILLDKDSVDSLFNISVAHTFILYSMLSILYLEGFKFSSLIVFLAPNICIEPFVMNT